MWLSCYDGDTCDFVIHLGLGVRLSKTVRFYGIDTPEVRGSERAEGLEVRDFVTNVLRHAHHIELQVPQRLDCGWLEDCDEHGKYGRLLANVIVDSQSLSALLLATGRAELY
jgi:micrococcal nuclease